MSTLLSMAGNGLTKAFSSFFAFAAEAFRNFRFVDALDILVLATLFFFAFRFLSGRKTGAILIGILFCLTLLIVSALIGLSGTYFIFSHLFEIGVLALVIIFQPELREALEKIGAGSYGGLLSLSERRKQNQIYYQAIENICAAVEDLSKTRTGALIVIARTTSLSDVMESGVKINADVNSFLLRNLFFNRAPLHDGAVVIDEARIACAGCLLPLTRRSDVDGDLGTRHRAAIGISEVSDAITIVVSEETGTVSVAYDCTLKRGFDADSLRTFLLRKIFVGRPAKK